MKRYRRLRESLRPYGRPSTMTLLRVVITAATRVWTALFVKPVIDKIFFKKISQMMHLRPTSVIAHVFSVLLQADSVLPLERTLPCRRLHELQFREEALSP